MGVSMSTRHWVLAFALLVFSASGHANVVAGKDYNLLPAPQRTDSPGKVEVIEFFSYGCPHCYEFHDHVMAWAGKLPADVVFKRVAVGFGQKAWAELAKAYYALEATGDLKKVDTALFDAVHKQRMPLADQRSITEWVGKHGVDTAKFSAAYNSFGVNTRTAQSDRMVVSYQVSGIPMLVVNGKYTPLGRTYDEMLGITSELVAKAKSEVAAKR